MLALAPRSLAKAPFTVPPSARPRVEPIASGRAAMRLSPKLDPSMADRLAAMAMAAAAVEARSLPNSVEKKPAPFARPRATAHSQRRERGPMGRDGNRLLERAVRTVSG